MKMKKLSGLLMIVLSVILMMSTLCLPASAAKSISKATVTVASAIYTGKTLKPKVTVKLSGKTLSSKYYTLTYKNNKNIGTASVTVKGKNGYSGSVKKTFKIVPGKVTNLKVTTDASTAKLTWKAVAGATLYRVDLYTGGKWVRKVNTEMTSAEIKNLKSYTSYSFRVRAYKEIKETYYTGAYSSTVKAKTKVGTPSSLSSNINGNTIKIMWSTIKNADYYQVWIYDGDEWTAKTTSKTYYNFKNLDYGKTYKFKVRAYVKENGERIYGSYSKTFNFKTHMLGPKNLSAKNVTYNSAEISWSALEGAEKYKISLSDVAHNSETFTTTSTSYKFTNLPSSSVYTVNVSAYIKDSKSYTMVSGVKFCTLPEEVTRITLEKIGDTSASVYWDTQLAATGYDVYLLTVDKDGNTLSKTLLGSTKDIAYTAKNLKSTTAYRFEVAAYRDFDGKKFVGKSGLSKIFTTLPGKVENLKALSSGNTVALTWSVQSGADGYEVYDSNKNLLKELGADKGIYTHYNLEEGKGYTFYVRSFVKNSDGTKTYGDYTEISTLAGGAKVTGVSFTKKTTSMTAGDTFATAIKIEPADAKNTAVTYTSSSPDVAQIDRTGKITALKDGVTKITVTTDDGRFTDYFTLRVEEVKLQSVSVDSSYSAYVNEGLVIKPTFTPSNVSDKSFTLTGSDYSYTYKGGLFGTSTKTDVCKFSDYFHIDNNAGLVFAKKSTIEPETGNAFSFTVKLTASNGKTATFKLSATKRLISVYYAGDVNPWYYGNTVKLSADVDSSAGFRADSLIWSTSNKSIATVSQDGTVSCIGTGEVTITATAPVGTKNHSITVYVAPVLKLTKDYYENCTVGGSYQLSTEVKPAGTSLNISYLSSDENIATVSGGKVTFHKSGSVTIYVSSGSAATVKAVLTTGSCTLPSGSTSALLSVMENGANKIKTAKPALYASSLPTFTNVKIHEEGSFKTSDLIGIFESFASSQSKFIPAVTSKNYPTSDEYNSAYSSYLASVPVSGQSLTMIPGLEDSDIKSLKVIDNGSYTYDIRLTLNDELMSTLPSRPETTAHGKVFDILGASYMTMIQEGLSSSSSGVSMKYSAFKQTYNNSTFTLTFDKITGNVVNMNYDMNVHIEIVDLKLTMTLITAIDSTVTFDVNNLVNYEVSY